MRLSRTLSLLLICAFPFALYAQDAAKQSLNDQLFAAARAGDAAAVKTALDKGADVNAKFRYGATALFKAAEKGHTEVVRLLLERGADANIKDTFYGATAMTWALSNKHVGVVSALLDKGAESVDDVLGAGASEGNAELVQLALSKGGAKPASLSMALAAAEKGKHAEVAALLRKAGAVPPPAADFQVDAETLKSYEGSYKSERGSEINVTVKSGKLMLGAGGQSFTLGAFDKVNFRPLEFEGASLTFNVEGGKAVSFNFKQGSNETIFKRVEPAKQP
jgi:ankyrin repeat protein